MPKGIYENNGKRGFSAMSAEIQRAIAKKGGKALHEKGLGYRFTPEQVRRGGKNGGKKVSKDRKHMAEIGRIGGKAPRRSRADSANFF